MFSFFSQQSHTDSSSSSDDDHSHHSDRDCGSDRVSEGVSQHVTAAAHSPIQVTVINDDTDKVDNVSTPTLPSPLPLPLTTHSKEGDGTQELSEDDNITIDDITDDIPQESTTVVSSKMDISPSEFAQKLQVLEERNKKMTKQLSTLQGIITSKSSLYLEYKKKFEVCMINK
jgi:hypothetical protein